MKLFVFNPEHDMALASNLLHFTPPRAACLIRRNMDFLPSLWAEPEDIILVEDNTIAEARARQLNINYNGKFFPRDRLQQQLLSGLVLDAVCPWGWDLNIRNDMLQYGIESALLPDSSSLDAIRKTSHRRWASENLLLPLRNINGTTGVSCAASTVDEVQQLLSLHGSVVLKAPWSGSGRGIRYVGKRCNVSRKRYDSLTSHLKGWIKNVIKEQACVMVEPWYDKAVDLGMEFYAYGNGSVKYSGLSLFHATDGVYDGNILGSEDSLEARLCRFVSADLLHEVARETVALLSSRLHKSYQGPLGIDMMIVRDESKWLLHPCVELNLRATMGHVALALSRNKSMKGKLMHITAAPDYCLKISSVSQP